MKIPTLLVALAAASALHAQPSELGHLDFPTSATGEAQQQFLRGVAALHSFWYEEAILAFERARELEPDFAMAYWGAAMTYNHPLWGEQDLQAAREVLSGLGATRAERLAKAPTERERGYLRAVELLYGAGEARERTLAYEQAMGELQARYPEDREAAVFHALSLLGAVERGERGFRRQMRAAAILEPIFRENPDHPGAAHYLIHAYDDPDHAPLGLPAARRYADIAPAAHHALHMPTHIFVQLGMWEDVARSNRRSYDASDAWVKRDRLAASKRDFHSLSWLQYAQLMLGQLEQARATLGEMQASIRELPDDRSLGYGDEMLARQVIEAGDWGAAAGLERDVPDSERRVQALLALGMAAAHRGDAAAARGYADRLGSVRQGLESDGKEYPARGVAIAEDEVRALAAMAGGQLDEALTQAGRAADLEQLLAPPSGPPVPIKPAGELLAELLLESDQATEAEARFRASLDRIPARTPSRLGLARAVAAQGRDEEAARLYAELRRSWTGSDPELAKLAAPTGVGGSD